MRKRSGPASLEVRVLHAETQVMHHRRRIGIHASLLGLTLHRQLTSPSVLFLAGGLGFLAERCTNRQASTPNPVQPPGVAGRGPFATALKLAGMVRTLMAVFPSTPSAQSGYPVQAPDADFDPSNSAYRF